MNIRTLATLWWLYHKAKKARKEGHPVPRSVVFKIALLVLKAALPSLKKMAQESGNQWDDIGVQILEALVSAFEAGEIKIS